MKRGGMPRIARAFTLFLLGMSYVTYAPKNTSYMKVKIMSNVLLGTAVGDALGVPFEKKLCNFEGLVDWDGKTYLGSEHHKLQPGQYSDDTQMSLMVAESLID